MADAAVVFDAIALFIMQQQRNTHPLAQRQAEGLRDQHAVNLRQTGRHRHTARQQRRQRQRTGSQKRFQQHSVHMPLLA